MRLLAILIIFFVTSAVMATSADTVIESRKDGGKVIVSPRDSGGNSQILAEFDPVTGKVTIPSGIALDTDVIGESSTHAGVTVDSVLLKDGKIATSNAVDANAIAASAVETSEILNGTIVDVDISTAASIDRVKSHATYSASNYRVTNTDSSTNSWYNIPNTTLEQFDDEGRLSNATYTATQVGVYLAGLTVGFANNATGVRGVRIKHGTLFKCTSLIKADATIAAEPSVVCPINITASGQTIIAQYFQNSNTTLSIQANSTTWNPHFWVIYLGKR